jgi:heptosyltransferase III
LRRLIIRPGAIGDTILAFPAMQHLRAEFTEIWVRSEVVPLVRFADRVRALSSTGIDLLGIPDVETPPRLIETLASFDEIVSWYGTNRLKDRDFSAVLRGRVRFLPALPNAEMHAADFFLAQVGGAGPAVPRIDCGGRQREEFVVLHPFSGSPRKNWPLARFLELESRLTALGLRVEWAARPGWVRFENLGDLAQWLSVAGIYVGNDSGIAHLAGAVGTPVVALFGPTDPAVWAPRGPVVKVLRGDSVEEIEVADVLAAVTALREPL